jgi:hypothetical protein
MGGELRKQNGVEFFLDFFEVNLLLARPFFVVSVRIFWSAVVLNRRR